jgi:hypothetical protein
MPTTTGFATDLITFSRGSLATVTDSDGYIKWAHHNLLLASEQLDTSSWTKTSATIAANSIAAPDNAITADTIAASGANGTVLQSYTAVAIPYVFGVWLRRKTGTGNIQIAADNGTYTTVTITNDWALYTVTQTPTAGTKSAGIRIVTNGDEVYAWGAHLYRSDLGGMQANASAYPYYDPSTLKNLLGFTELLTTGWTNTNTTDTQVAIAAPNGSANSIDVAATAGNGTLLASLSLLASPYTFSIWLRRKTGTGTVEITVDGTTYVTAAVTADWQRFSTTLTPTAGTKTPGIRIVTSGDAVYAWGAQLSDSASLDPYTPNFGAAPSAAAAHGPRLDYDPSTLAAKGLLVEEQRTNLLLNSNSFIAWTENISVRTLDSATSTSPVGTFTASLLSMTSATSSGLFLFPTVVNGTTYTFSGFFKAVSGSPILTIGAQANPTNGFVTFNTATGVITAAQAGVISSSVVNYGNGWYRVTVTVTATSTTIGIVVYNATGSAASVYIWGAQLEAGAFATSYIPTAAASVTRNADVAFVATSQFPYSATEGSIVANASTLAGALGSNNTLYTLGSDANNYFWNWVWSGASTLPRITVFSAGASQADLTSSSVTANTPFKTATGYKVNDFAYTVNGATVATDTSGSLPAAATRFSLGSREDATFYFNGHIRQITYIPRRLTNAELQARTA